MIAQRGKGMWPHTRPYAIPEEDLMPAMNISSELPLVLTMRQIQEIIGLSRPKVYELAHTRGFPVIRFGRALRVPRDSFLRWLDQQAGGQGDNDRNSKAPVPAGASLPTAVRASKP